MVIKFKKIFKTFINPASRNFYAELTISQSLVMKSVLLSKSKTPRSPAVAAKCSPVTESRHRSWLRWHSKLRPSEDDTVARPSVQVTVRPPKSRNGLRTFFEL